MSDPVTSKNQAIREEDGNNPNEEVGFLENLKIEEEKKPNKSGSMGLLDAEGYKFLDGSDSNSEDQNLKNANFTEDGYKGEPQIAEKNALKQ